MNKFLNNHEVNGVTYALFYTPYSTYMFNGNNYEFIMSGYHVVQFSEDKTSYTTIEGEAKQAVITQHESDQSDQLENDVGC